LLVDLVSYGFMADKLEPLEDSLEKIIENIRQLGVIVSDFQPNGQTVLNQKVNNIIGGLKEIDSYKSSLADIHIPLEVFDFIDAGKNPQLYTKDCLDKALSKNETVKGKIDLYKKFRQELTKQLGKVYPEEIGEYCRIRDQASSSSS